MNGGRLAHDVRSPFLHHIHCLVRPLVFSPNELKEGKEAYLGASLYGDEVNWSHLRASGHPWELNVGGEICQYVGWGELGGDGSSSPALCCGRSREGKRNKQIY